MKQHRGRMRALCQAAAVVAANLVPLLHAGGQTVVQSIFASKNIEMPLYGDAANWSPAGVPNNTQNTLYNVEVPSLQPVWVDINATISNLTLGAFAVVRGRTFTVTGTTTDLLLPRSGIAVYSEPDEPAMFDAGTLAAFSGNILRGAYDLSSNGSPATLRFRSANIVALSDGSLRLQGPLPRIVDENGNDALRNLARIESSASLSVNGHHFVAAAPLTNEGVISLGPPGDTGSFTAAAGLTNYDAATRTLRGGSFRVGYLADEEPEKPVELRFNGADVVRNGSDIHLVGEAARITDLGGLDALRNLAYNLASGSLRLLLHPVVTAGAFTNDGRLALDACAFTVSGPLTNYDVTTRTLTGGTYMMSRGATLSFSGADVVRNAASLEFLRGGRLQDGSGNNALRNFAENLESGSFNFGRGQTLTTTGNFTNAGRFTTGAAFAHIRLEITPAAEFTVPSGFQYTQTAGLTDNNGVLTAGSVNIRGGVLFGDGVINGNVVIEEATLGPMGSNAKISGNVTLSAGSQLRTGVSVRGFEVTGSAALAGTLVIDLAENFFPASDAVYTVFRNARRSISGTFRNAPHGARVPTVDGRGSFVVLYDQTTVKLTEFQAEPPAAQLLNISTRGHLHRAQDDPSGQRDVLIAGFIIYGAQPKTVVLRGIGPTLAASGVASPLNDPTLVLHGADGNVIATNGDWKDAQQAEIAASGLAPADEREAAIMATLSPGLYTVVLREQNGSGGTGLVEVYDASQNIASKLANISTRGFVDRENLLIGGVIAAGEGQGNAQIVVRALGPALATRGVAGTLADPLLEFRDPDGNLVAANDNWASNANDVPGELQPTNAAESAMRLSLRRGSYTAIVRGQDNAVGMAVVEFYDLRR